MIADKEQIAQGLDGLSLLAVAQQLGHGYASRLAHQVQKGGLYSREGVNHHPLVEGLETAAVGVQVDETPSDRGEHVVHFADASPDRQISRRFQGSPDSLASRRLADARPAGVVLQEHEIANEDRSVAAAQVQQQTVIPGNGKDGHANDLGQVRHDSFVAASRVAGAAAVDFHHSRSRSCSLPFCCSPWGPSFLAQKSFFLPCGLVSGSANLGSCATMRPCNSRTV